MMLRKNGAVVLEVGVAVNMLDMRRKNITVLDWFQVAAGPRTSCTTVVKRYWRGSPKQVEGSASAVDGFKPRSGTTA